MEQPDSVQSPGIPAPAPPEKHGLFTQTLAFSLKTAGIVGSLSFRASSNCSGYVIKHPCRHFETEESLMENITFKKTAPPEWLLAFWKEIDDKTFGKGFDCFAEDAQCRLGVAQWDGREVIRENLRKFIDTGFTAHHDVVEYWDGGALKVFRGVVSMTFDDPTKPVVKPTMTHFFYMDKNDPAKVSKWYGAVGPVGF
jgi:hypothetical protein